MVGDGALGVDSAHVGARVLTLVRDAGLVNGAVGMDLALVGTPSVGVAKVAALALADAVVPVAPRDGVDLAARVGIAGIFGLGNEITWKKRTISSAHI